MDRTVLAEIGEYTLQFSILDEQLASCLVQLMCASEDKLAISILSRFGFKLKVQSLADAWQSYLERDWPAAPEKSQHSKKLVAKLNDANSERNRIIHAWVKVNDHLDKSLSRPHDGSPIPVSVDSMRKARIDLMALWFEIDGFTSDVMRRRGQ